MFTCLICRFPTETDDAAVAIPGGACICVGCDVRLSGAARAMPRDLRRAVAGTVNALPDRDADNKPYAL